MSQSTNPATQDSAPPECPHVTSFVVGDSLICTSCRAVTGYTEATDDLEATTDGTNTEPPSELVQGSTNPKDDLDEMLLQYEISGKDGIAREEFLTQMQEYVTLARTEALKGIREKMTLFPPNGIYEASMFAVTVNDIDDAIAALQRDSPPNVSPTIQNPERVSENGVSDSQPGGTDAG